MPLPQNQEWVNVFYGVGILGFVGSKISTTQLHHYGSWQAAIKQRVKWVFLDPGEVLFTKIGVVSQMGPTSHSLLTPAAGCECKGSKLVFPL